MSKEIEKAPGGHLSPFERIKRTNDANNEYWESRDLAEVLEYTQYRNFEAVIEKAKLACFNSGHRIEDHFADVSKLIEIGKGARREIKVKTPIPARISLRMAKPILPSRRGGRNWRTSKSRMSGGYYYVKRCAVITPS
jgi:NADH:ubiquinone oxidoreductase subunit C